MGRRLSGPQIKIHLLQTRQYSIYPPRAIGSLILQLLNSNS